ncbi:cyclophilin-like domain-containing protein [Lipomyces kononenkoae]
MSSALEPPTTAKVVLHTTKGPIEIELWAKETPKASRNFLQLCLDGYYDGTIFHRVIPDFLIQGGDPTATGHGGQSIYTDEGGFPSEFHSRLRFNRRGLLGNAESEAMNDNSQFFITLAATPELQRKNTMFGRIMGDTIFNVLKIGEAERDRDDRPLYPTKITHAEILVNYFPDLKPRTTSQQKGMIAQQQKKVKRAATAKPKVKMSFGIEGEEDEDGAGIAKEYKSRFKMKSAHEVLNDSRLSKEVQVETAVVETAPQSAAKAVEIADPAWLSVKDKREKDEPTEEEKHSEQPKKPAVGFDVDNESQSGSLCQVTKVESQFDKINAEIAEMKSSLKRRANNNEDRKSHKKVSAVEEQRLKYLSKKTTSVSKKRQREQREADTLAMLHKFTSKLHAASSSAPLTPLKVSRRQQEFEDDGEQLCDLHNLPNCQSCLYYDNLSGGEDDPASIWNHSFVDEKSQRRKPQRIFSPPLEPKFQNRSQPNDRRDRFSRSNK